MKVNILANVKVDFLVIYLDFLMVFFGVTRLERPKGMKNKVKQAQSLSGFRAGVGG